MAVPAEDTATARPPVPSAVGENLVDRTGVEHTLSAAVKFSGRRGREPLADSVGEPTEAPGEEPSEHFRLTLRFPLGLVLSDVAPGEIADALGPEERWWLYTMTVATTGQAALRWMGWRKTLRAAIADNPFAKGEGLSPKARREQLRDAQLSLSL